MAFRRLSPLLVILVAAGCEGVVPPTVVQASATASSPVMLVDRGTLGISPAVSLFTPGQTQVFLAIPESDFSSSAAAVVWSTDDPHIASVGADGRLTAVSSGFTWLRAAGAAGFSAHPVSVAVTAPMTVAGVQRMDSCTSGFIMTCSAAWKGSASGQSFSLRYRTIGDGVVAEYQSGSARHHLAALVGRVVGPGQFRFFEPAFYTPDISQGAGGCCSRLTGFGVEVSDGKASSGTLVMGSSSATMGFRLTPQ